MQHYLFDLFLNLQHNCATNFYNAKSEFYGYCRKFCIIAAHILYMQKLFYTSLPLHDACWSKYRFIIAFTDCQKLEKLPG